MPSWCKVNFSPNCQKILYILPNLNLYTAKNTIIYRQNVFKYCQKSHLILPLLFFYCQFFNFLLPLKSIFLLPINIFFYCHFILKYCQKYFSPLLNTIYEFHNFQIWTCWSVSITFIIHKRSQSSQTFIRDRSLSFKYA